MRVLCALGQHQYGCPERGEGTEYAAFMPALARLGHEVRHFESWNQSSFADLPDLNHRLIRAAADFQPDVLLVVPFTHEIWLETIAIIGRLGTTTVCWTTDDSWKYKKQSRFFSRVFDVMTTTYPEFVPRYRRDGQAEILTTQWAARAEALRPPITASRCAHGVTFVGAAHGTRRAMVQQLERRGLDVECFGQGWPNGPLSTEDVARVMRESVISLNFANSEGSPQIKARNFEVPGAGGLLLAEDVPGLERFYIAGEEMVTYRSLDELVDRARWLIREATTRDAIAVRGYQRTQREHTYDMRLQQVLEMAVTVGGRKRVPDARHLSSGHLAMEAEWMRRAYRPSRWTNLARRSLVLPCQMVFGRQRGQRAARRLVHELSWRLGGHREYTPASLTARMFPTNQ